MSFKSKVNKPHSHGTHNHGNVLRKAYKLSTAKCEHSHLSTGQITHLWLVDESQTNLLAFLPAVPCLVVAWKQDKRSL